MSISSATLAVEDMTIAEQLIEQNDCENALPVLVSVWKAKSHRDSQKLLMMIKDCSLKVKNYALKAKSELLLSKLNPSDERLQLDYLTSLFFLSKFKRVLSYSESQVSLKKHFDYWMLRARSHFELGQTEQAIEDLQNQLKRGEVARRAEIYYWLGQFYSQEQDYELAISYYNKARSEPEKPQWLSSAINDLITSTEEKNKKWRGLVRLRYGTDTNILRSDQPINDFTQMLDISIDYDYFKKIKRTLNFGFDYSYQGYNTNSTEQTASFAPRLGQSYLINEAWSFDYMLSAGKILTNNRSDQNYFVAFSQLNYKIESDFEIQTAFSFFENLNNNPIQQVAISSILSVGMGSDFLWIGPVLKVSRSPEPIIDNVTYGYPVVTDYSLTTRYHQVGLLSGYLLNLNESYSIQIQNSMNRTQYAEIDLSDYNKSNIEGDGPRVDLFQSTKLAIKYRYSNDLRFELSVSNTHNESVGFQGFYLTDVSSNSYDQTQVLLGATYRWP